MSIEAGEYYYEETLTPSRERRLQILRDVKFLLAWDVAIGRTDPQDADDALTRCEVYVFTGEPHDAQEH